MGSSSNAIIPTANGATMSETLTGNPRLTTPMTPKITASPTAAMNSSETALSTFRIPSTTRALSPQRLAACYRCTPPSSFKTIRLEFGRLELTLGPWIDGTERFDDRRMTLFVDPREINRESGMACGCRIGHLAARTVACHLG